VLSPVRAAGSTLLLILNIGSGLIFTLTLSTLIFPV
jgi:hypothetical protein